MQNIFWTAYTHSDRHKTIIQIQEIISKYGDIVDFHFFSDLSMSMTIEIKEQNINKLYVELANVISFQEVELINSKSNRERTLYLNITFSSGSGDLRTEIPKVPG